MMNILVTKEFTPIRLVPTTREREGGQEKSIGCLR